jgi:choline dehydrogenase-like flavoprotein
MNFLIIGSGPAGVSSALPLLEAGHAVTMLSAGRPISPPSRGENWWSLRAERMDGWRTLQGGDARVWASMSATSPKFRTPRAAALFAGYVEALGIETSGFVARGALALGGLSQVWGAGVACFNDTDLAGTALKAESLAPHYDHLAKHIGVSGLDDDLGPFFGRHITLQPPTPLNQAAKSLELGYSRARQQFWREGVVLGRARNAVLTLSERTRGACTACALCLWGCGEGAIYAADHELEALQRFHLFELRHSQLVTMLRREADVWVAEARDEITGELLHYAAPVVLLGAGALGTARLIRAALGLHGVPGPLISNPTSVFALWLPRHLGSAQEHDVFALSQLSLSIAGPEGTSGAAFANLFQLSGLPASELLSRVPLSLPTARRVLRILMPGMLVGNLFLPGLLSRHQLTLRADGALALEGGFASEVASRLADVRRRLRAALLRAGALILPGGFQPSEPGSDLHYAGTVPMRIHPVAGECDILGEVAGLRGLYVIDGSALPVLPTKAHTFTVMANARRIAQSLAHRASASVSPPIT